MRRRAEGAMYQPPIINFPVFSVAWADVTGDDGSSTPAVVAAGGGGAGKTGVGNNIVSFSWSNDRSFMSAVLLLLILLGKSYSTCKA